MSLFENKRLLKYKSTSFFKDSPIVGSTKLPAKDPDDNTDEETINRTKAIAPGATPKLTISANESSCLPISPCLLSNLATKPSKKSRIIAKSSRYTDKSRRPWSAQKIDKTPDSRFPAVNKFGKLNMVQSC
jgi:hypothetical protein